MKTKLHSPWGRRSSGFTFVELVGVVAVSSILAMILVPRILSAIEETGITRTVSDLRSVQVATVEYFGKYGRFGGKAGRPAALPVRGWDSVLVDENFLERPFQTRLGDSASIAVVRARDLKADQGIAFTLEGTGSLTEDSIVVEAMLENVPLADAWELSMRIDGPSASASQRDDSSDLQGRVVYCMAKSDSPSNEHYSPQGADKSVSSCAEVTVHVYLAHH